MKKAEIFRIVILILLGDNEIFGTIPKLLKNHVNLIFLDLNGNHFTCIIPTTFEKMERLGLFGNRLSGEIPTSLDNLTQLFEIALLNNGFEGTIPPSLVNRQNLQFLDISQNNLNGSIQIGRAHV